MRESKIERYFCQQVALHGGSTRKLRYLGAPDRMAIWPRFCRVTAIHFVELKAPTGRTRSWQRREHQRLRNLGCKVFTLHTIAAVDDYIERLRHD